MPVAIQDACFRVLEQHHFIDGVKSDLCGVIHLNKGVTIVLNECLPKALLTPTEITHFEW